MSYWDTGVHILEPIVFQEPQPEAAAVLLRYPWICSLRGYGSLLSYDGLPPPLRILDVLRVVTDGRCCCTSTNIDVQRSVQYSTNQLIAINEGQIADLLLDV